MPFESERPDSSTPNQPDHPAEKARNKVFIVDDHCFCCEILGRVIESDNSFELIGWETDADLAVEKISAKNADLVILDLVMPTKSGLEVISSLKRLRWKGKIIAFSGQATDQAIASAFVNGASAFVEKKCSVEELLATMQAVAKGLTPMSSRTSSVLRSLIRAKQTLKPLSASDVIILRSFAREHSAKQVADATGLSLSAVYKAKARLCRRLGATSIASLATHAWKLGISADDDSDVVTGQSAVPHRL